MRHIARAAVVLVAVVLAGCQTTSVPERRDLLGSWVSTGFPGATIRMTLAETARSVVGAGSWLTLLDAVAFDVIGAIASDEVSLLLRFDDRPDINFQGFFEDEDILSGTITGAGYRRQPVVFEREDLQP